MALTKVTGQVIKNTTDVTVGVLTVTNTLAVGGTVSIGGTLTYEDVTNVDAVGLITARNGIVVGSGITLSKDGDIFATGVTTATTFVGAVTGNVTGNATGLSGTPNISCGTIAGSTGTFSGAVSGTTGTFSGAVSGTTGTFSGAVSGTTGTFTGDVDIADSIVHTGDNSKIRFPSNDVISFETSGNERLRITSSGTVLKGLTTARANFANNTSGVEYGFQIEGTTGITAGLTIIRNSNDANDGGIVLGKTRASSTGGNTVVQAGDDLGNIAFAGSDGTSLQLGAEIFAEVQTGVGNDDLPTDLIFKTNGGTTSTTERLRILSTGEMGLGTATPPTGCFHIHLTETPELNLFSTQHAQNNTCKLNFGIGQSASVDGNTGARIEMNIPNSGGAMNGELKFHTNVGDSLVERLRIASDGEVFIGDGLGSTNRSTLLSISGAYQEATGALAQMGLYSSDSYAQNKGGSIVFGGQDGSVARQYFAGIAGVKENTTSGNYAGVMKFYTRPAGSTPVERVRMASDGAIRFGTTAAIQTEKYTFFRAESEQSTLAYFHSGASADVSGVLFRHGRALSGYNGKQIGFLRSDGNEVGSIVSGASSTAFNTSSDYRLKENAVSILDGITRLKTLKPYKFNFKDEPSVVVDGFFAHEVTAVPQAVHGEKDAIDDNGDPKYQSIDHSKLVPLLTAALQEAVAKIEVLESEVAALKSS